MSPESFAYVADAEIARAIARYGLFAVREDVTQEAWLALVESSRSYDLSDPEIAGRLRISIRGQILDWMRAHSGRRSGRPTKGAAVTGSLDGLDLASDVSVEDDVAGAQMFRAVFARLSDRDAKVLRDVLSGEQQRETGLREGVPVATVASWRRRALAEVVRLRTRMEGGA